MRGGRIIGRHLGCNDELATRLEIGALCTELEMDTILQVDSSATVQDQVGWFEVFAGL